MNRILIALCCLFFSVGKKDATVLNPKLPVIVSVLECPQQKEMEEKIITALRNRSLKTISYKKGVELFQEQIETARLAQSPEDYKSIKSAGTGMMIHMAELIDKMPIYAQRMYIKVVSGMETGIDSCYYYIREQPEPMPLYSKRKIIDTKVIIQDSIFKKNDIDVLVSAIVQRAVANPN